LFDEIADVIAQMKTKFEIVENIFDKYNYEKYFEVEDTNEKLQIILEAVNFVLKSDETKIRFLKEFLLLLKLFVMGISTKEAEEIRDKVAFFEAVKTRINKLENSDF
jgi:type I restriction enzyme R subunit